MINVSEQSASDAVAGASVDPAEVARFSAMAAEWWNPVGKFKPLHRFNPVRIGYIRDAMAAHFGRDATGEQPLKGLRLLDIGCGGGLLCEPMARLGATVLGADASPKNIAIAKLHAGQSGLAIDYRATTAEALAEAGERFDIILNMEVVEHVADPGQFIATCGKMLKPEGAMVVATLNRTVKSYALAIVGAEYVLGWLPRGTHDWKKFVKPHELARALRDGGCKVSRLDGVSYNPVSDQWRLSRDTDVNYLTLAVKA